jgi:deoxyribonuclease-4
MSVRRLPTDVTLRVGAHVSVAGGVHNAVESEVDVGGNCGQIFTHSPQVWRDPDIADEEAAAFREGTSEKLTGPWVIHSSYLVNLCTPKDDLREKSVASMQAEVDAAQELAIEFVNVHLGAHTGAGVEGGLANAVEALDAVEVPEGVRILLESDAGSGTKLGDEFWHLAEVIGESRHDLGVCLDTAHLFAAGHDLSTPGAVDETVAAFDEVVGLDRLECVHLNDSKHGLGTNKDEHAHVGEGEIGVDGMARVVNHPDLRDQPFVLETPTEDGRGFAWNVERVRELRD